MNVQLGPLLAQCPYCSSTEFVAAEADSLELTCAKCGGSASRRVVLERVAERAAELGELTLARLRQERRQQN